MGTEPPASEMVFGFDRSSECDSTNPTQRKNWFMCNLAWVLQVISTHQAPTPDISLKSSNRSDFESYRVLIVVFVQTYLAISAAYSAHMGDGKR
ncbi:MAG: hypothetical protein AAFY26_12980 [Cyanobacteria bacterium J06638_22]